MMFLGFDLFDIVGLIRDILLIWYLFNKMFQRRKKVIQKRG